MCRSALAARMISSDLARVERNQVVTLVIVVAAIVAVVLLALIVTLGRSRFSDESERFRYVSALTSQWSRQQTSATTDVSAEAIDLRDHGAVPSERAGAARDGIRLDDHR